MIPVIQSDTQYLARTTVQGAESHLICCEFDRRSLGIAQYFLRQALQQHAVQPGRPSLAQVRVDRLDRHDALSSDDGRLLTLEDTVEFFNVVLRLRLTDPEKSDLVAFMRAL